MEVQPTQDKHEDKLLIGLDYDETYLLNKPLFDIIIPVMQEQGHRVFLITIKDKEPNGFIEAKDRLGTSSVVTGGLQKSNAIYCDLWVDAFPSTIPTSLELRGMLTGCLANGED